MTAERTLWPCSVNIDYIVNRINHFEIHINYVNSECQFYTHQIIIIKKSFSSSYLFKIHFCDFSDGALCFYRLSVILPNGWSWHYVSGDWYFALKEESGVLCCPSLNKLFLASD